MRSRLLVPLVVFSSALLVYLLTMPPGLTWANDSADGGDLIAAVVSGGVPHPSGYPTYVLLATPLARLPWHNPAWRVTLLSALAGAAAAAFVAATVQELLGRTNRAALAAAVAGLALAFSPLFWGQATVAEVYALHACLAAVLLWIVVRGQQSGSLRWPVAAGLIFGLALGNHLTSIWLAPLFVAGVLPQTSHARLRKSPNQHTEVNATTESQSAPRGGDFRSLVAGTGGLLAGLCVYLVLPLRAAGSPPINWGNASTWQGFWWLVSGELYRGFVLAVPVTAFPGRLAAAGSLLIQSFLPWGLALAAVGALIWPRIYRRVNVAMLASAGLALVWALSYNTSDSYLSWLPAWPFVAVWLGVGFAEMAEWLSHATPRGRWLTVALAAAMIALPLTFNWQTNDRRRDRSAEDFVAGILQTVEPDAVVLTAGDRATFGLWYGRYGAGQRPDVLPVSRDLWALASYRDAIGAAQPALAGDTVEALIENAMTASRPVYLTQVDQEPADLPAPPAGAVWESLAGPLEGTRWQHWQIYRLTQNAEDSQQ